CARDNDCGLPANATASTLPEDPTDLHVDATEREQLSFGWRRPSKRNIIDGYQLTLYDRSGMKSLKEEDIIAPQHQTILSGLYQHYTYNVNLRACFREAKTGTNICSKGIYASATTNPNPLPLTIAERTASSMVYHFSPYGGYREHFNYTLRVRGRKDEVVCDATKGRCQVTGLPANSKIEASLVVCCKHKLCSLPSDQVGFTKPLGEFDCADPSTILYCILLNVNLADEMYSVRNAWLPHNIIRRQDFNVDESVDGKLMVRQPVVNFH
ncbi:unnamed protein product, partial [Taenia asiatica]|uniref:Fibronectin type-III domain-containing protein n=1 Tax=Taenia asiatica TaxID=60517 RepID=A0A0R3VZ49_TAEAS